MKIVSLFKPRYRRFCKNILLTPILAGVLGISISNAQTISAGGSMVIGSGVVVNSNYDMAMQGGGTLKVMGTLILKNNLVNQKTGPDSLGTGTIEFSGTINQTVSGPNIFTNLKIDNAAGVSITGSDDPQVTGTLNLTNGPLTLGSRNLMMGPAATVSGAPAASSMVVANGSGELRKAFSSASSFTYPVGDNTGTAEYSPVTLSFSSGTFGTGNYAGVSLVNAKYPDANITGSYLNRYWNLTQTGITGFNCTATFKYADQDIAGTEGDLFCTKVDPSPYVTYSAVNTASNLLTAGGLTSFSKFTGSMGIHEVGLTAFLEGPYSSGVMATTLNTMNLLPHQQPYNTAPWLYSGTEMVDPIPAGVVDWVLLELRQADQPSNATAATIIKKRAAFVKSDGTVVDLDGTSPVRFYNSNITQNLYPVVRHRNHLAIMAANAVTKTGGIYTYNFSTGIGQAFGGSAGYKQIGTGVFGMVSGDADADSEISVLDFSNWATNFGSTMIYLPSDIDMLDGEVSVLDFSKWATNFGITHPIDGSITPVSFMSQVPK